MSPARAILVTARPKQWVKNAFVVAPLVFSKHLFDPAFALRAAAAAVAFCALSGAVYTFNDLRDVEQDRSHPLKRHRPIASGALGETAALWTAIGLALAALAACAALALPLAAVGATYLTLNLAYSIKLKHIAFVDVGIIATGFLLRVYGGALAIDVPMSGWLLACTALLAMLLGFGKRAHELNQAASANREVASTRAALAGYSLHTLQLAMFLLAAATSATYALYTRDERTVHFFGTDELIWTLPFCVVGIARFIDLALWRPVEQSPTDAILRDPWFMSNIVAWGAVVLYIIYYR